MNVSNPKSAFVDVNGVRLHYLDWGGNGQVLIFLTGMGCSAYIFSKFAPRFAGQFHVLALTRRGQGDSDCPETGYDADTLTEDILGFMDHLCVEKAILAGHSLAGVELTHFAATHPDRVEKLVYLDALDDRREESIIVQQNPLRNIKLEKEESSPHTLEEYIVDLKRNAPGLAAIWNDVWDEEISHTVKVNEAGIVVDKMPDAVSEMMIENLVKGYAPQRVDAKLPILSIYAQKVPRVADAYTVEQKAAFDEFHRIVELPFFRSLISEFQTRFPHARIVVIPGGHHYCFMAQEDLVYNEMENFLLDR
jgi:pimeloyl-ACP methyl ester carboxylesterase